MSTAVSVREPGAATTAPEIAPGVHPLIRARWSPRSFSSREVSPEDLRTLLDAARWAASSYNEQPWRFLVATKSDPAAYEKMLSILVESNQKWARTAPVLILTIAKRNFSRNGAPNHHALHDTGAALANLMLQAVAMGMNAHGMAGYDHGRARKVLNIPDDYELGAAVALGYAASPDQLPEPYRERETAPRQRKPLKEIVFGAGLNEPAPL
jgi:nitroreductase